MTELPDLPTPEAGRDAAEAFVAEHLAELVGDEVRGSEAIRGGQRAADAALAAFDVGGYARRRNEVFPPKRRGASQLSPYIRHGLLTLPEVWSAVGQSGSGSDRAGSDRAGSDRARSDRDVSKFRDELMWQEFARHWYARLGRRTATGVRSELAPVADGGWNRDLACIDLVVGELETDGWLVNQTRMWLASHWSIRTGQRWQDGEDEFFTHLLDGSRAANRLGWQWTTGVGSSKPYGFSRFQVEKRAPGVCDTCALNNACPIENWPNDPTPVAIERPSELKSVAALPATVGPVDIERDEAGALELVWLTAESLALDEPALAANPDLPVVFVFDAPLLQQLQLSSKRLVFLVETLAEIAEERTIRLALGDPVEVLDGQRLAVTHAPVPGFVERSAKLNIGELHPWPWLARPTTKAVTSFSAWRKSVKPTAQKLG